jgi:uncharacterized membrane protein YwzB
VTRRRLLLAVVAVLVALAVAAFVLAHVGGRHGISQLL